jgi:RNA polymerase sigma factor (sigma-70 family)
LNDDAQHALSLLDEHGRRLHALLLRITLREDAAEDLMQELFLRLSRPHTLGSAADRVGYAVRAATRLAFDWRRSQRRRRDASPIVVEPASQPEGGRWHERQDLQQVLDAIERLPPMQRDVVVMRYLEDRPYDEIAAAMKKPKHQIRALCHKALSRLRAALERGGPRPVP